MRDTYKWLATFQKDGEPTSVSTFVWAASLLDAAGEAQRHRPSFYEPEDLAKIERRS